MEREEQIFRQSVAEYAEELSLAVELEDVNFEKLWEGFYVNCTAGEVKVSIEVPEDTENQKLAGIKEFFKDLNAFGSSAGREEIRQAACQHLESFNWYIYMKAAN